MPYEVHEDKIVMRAGEYNLPRCCCGETWRLNTVHREKLPCFDYIPPTWVGLTADDWDEIFGNALTIGEAIKVTEAKLKEKNT